MYLLTEFAFTSEFFIYILDLFGTVAFAITGAFKAIEKKFDVVGILLLATITGVAGGTIRDVVLGTTPNSIIDPVYVISTVVSGVVIFFLYSKLKKHWNLFLKFDAIGLGVFTIIGATFAYNIFGLNFFGNFISRYFDCCWRWYTSRYFCKPSSNSFCKRILSFCKFYWNRYFFYNFVFY